MATKLFDSAIVGNAQEAVDFIGNILESSTEYSIIGKDLDGKILLWNEGARRLYGYEPEEVVGKANSSILHTPEDVRVRQAARDHATRRSRDGKWEGTLDRVAQERRALHRPRRHHAAARRRRSSRSASSSSRRTSPTRSA